MTLEDTVTDRFTRLSDVLAATDARLRQGEAAAATPVGHRLRPARLLPRRRAASGRAHPPRRPAGRSARPPSPCRSRARRSRTGHPVLYVCYEHDSVNILERLLAAEAGERAGVDAVPLRAVRALLEGDGSAASLTDKLAETPGGAEALASISVDLERWFSLRGGVRTDGRRHRAGGELASPPRARGSRSSSSTTSRRSTWRPTCPTRRRAWRASPVSSRTSRSPSALPCWRSRPATPPGSPRA